MSYKPIKRSDQGKVWASPSRVRRGASRPEQRYFLIVTEDTKSSVFYFKALESLLKERSSTIGLLPKGGGRNTQSLVKFAKDKRNRAKWLKELYVPVEDFDETWVLFDKDDFPVDRFDNAIVSTEGTPNFYAGWSNECFELWYLLHRKDVTAPIEREKIYCQLKKLYDAPYCKGEEGVRFHNKMAQETVKKLDCVIKRAKRLEEQRGTQPPSASNPCTHIYQLIEKLRPFFK